LGELLADFFGLLIFSAIEGSFKLGVFHFKTEMKADFLSFLWSCIAIKVEGDCLCGVRFGEGFATILANKEEEKKESKEGENKSCLVHIYDEPKKKY
jgi:hypothetical protein